MKKTYRNRILGAVIVCIVFLSIPVGALVWAGFILPPQYDESYYGELSAMYEKLTRTQEKKIILIGGSSLAFGVDVDLMGRMIDDYEICSFGLYGAIGTKAMLDLAADTIREGDIVIISPELTEQTMSMYFSPGDMWMAVDGKPEMLKKIEDEDYASMAAAFPHFASQKLFYYEKKEKPRPDGVYAKASFNENCSMVYEREHNIMPLMYDENVPICFSEELIQEEFVDYLNDYYKECCSKGAMVYYNFCPMNRLAVDDSSSVSDFYRTLNDALCFPILGNPEDYLFDEAWFYDSNFHMNSPGMKVYTQQMVKDVKLAVEDGSSTLTETPEKPVISVKVAHGDLSDSDCFLYEEKGQGYQIIGLSDSGMKKEVLIIPTEYKGQPVWSFSADTFRNNEKLEEITVPSSVVSIPGSCFRGCSNLKKLNLLSPEPVCAVDSQLLEGVSRLEIWLPDYDSYVNYAVNYYWSQYADNMRFVK